MLFAATTEKKKEQFFVFGHTKIFKFDDVDFWMIGELENG